MGKLVDNIIAGKLLKMLVTPFEETKAFKLGLIDENGIKVRSAKTSEEETAYNYLTRFIFNIKKILMKRDSKSIKDLHHAAFLVKECDYSNLDDAEMCEEIEALFYTLDESDYVLEPSLAEEVITTAAIAAKDKPLKMIRRKKPIDLGDKK